MTTFSGTVISTELGRLTMKDKTARRFLGHSGRLGSEGVTPAATWQASGQLQERNVLTAEAAKAPSHMVPRLFMRMACIL